MLSNAKLKQKREIRSLIEQNGWKIINFDEYEWWENEVWTIESVWSLIGKQAFIVYVVDPQNLTDKSDIWAVLVSSERPKNWQGEQDDFTLVLNKKWKDNLPNLNDYLSKIRNK